MAERSRVGPRRAVERVLETLAPPEDITHVVRISPCEIRPEWEYVIAVGTDEGRSVNEVVAVHTTVTGPSLTDGVWTATVKSGPSPRFQNQTFKTTD